MAIFRHTLGLLAACLLLSGAGEAAAPVSVRFPSLDGHTRLDALLFTPERRAPFPAVVFLHGCSGLGRGGDPFSIYRAWAEHLVNSGLGILLVDSATPRGYAATCGRSAARKVMYRDRPKDAYGALAYLQALPAVRHDRIGLMGWSQGGGIVLLTIVTESIGRPAPPPRHDFRAAVAFYPSACSDKHQSRPFTTVDPGRWSSGIPALVLMGAADNWTPAAPCAAFLEAARRRGNPISYEIYTGAHHAFDAPDMPVHRRTEISLNDGAHPIVGTNPDARSAAMGRVGRFLRRHLLDE